MLVGPFIACRDQVCRLRGSAAWQCRRSSLIELEQRLQVEAAFDDQIIDRLGEFAVRSAVLRPALGERFIGRCKHGVRAFALQRFGQTGILHRSDELGVFRREAAMLSTMSRVDRASPGRRWPGSSRRVVPQVPEAGETAATPPPISIALAAAINRNMVHGTSDPRGNAHPCLGQIMRWPR